jgi:hypothetical protein
VGCRRGENVINLAYRERIGRFSRDRRSAIDLNIE